MIRIMKSSLDSSLVNVLTIQKGHRMDANKEIRWRKEWQVSEMKNDPHYKLIIIIGRNILVKFIAVLLNIFSHIFAHTYFNDTKVMLQNMLFIIIKISDDRNFWVSNLTMGNK